MNRDDNKPARYILGPDGNVFTVADLPSARTRRWVARRKAEVVVAVSGGLLDLEDACRRYRLTVEEFQSWRRAVERFGLKGLHITRVQQYRRPSTD
jgi:Protein of unknown function (DUF1153)